jgi:uncharacterized protein YehS (DUF1456 family)
MNNNDILRRLRFAFDFSNKEAVALFSLDVSSSAEMTQAAFLKRLAKDEDDDFVECTDIELAAFLDGLIVSKRGARDPAPEAMSKPDDFRMSKNDILKKLRIAMSFRVEEMLSTLVQGGTNMSKSELGALFRSPNHKHYRSCGNQVLRNFIKGLTLQLRPDEASSIEGK